MDDIQSFTEEFDHSFENLQNQIDHSLSLINHHPEHKKEIIDMWAKHIKQFTTYAFQSSEKHNNRDVYKAITKALIFRR
ncbi:hypothetical protein [Petroclostridium sp. X23]|uniref:hypothetical protein n=1 Tax=Petroclostridium sp. X23 TaxID=3045146 RepID=UPI0024ACA4D1|nr:hypothetical protein [Petroclostridium sp. X23]WHH60577.1 hypothetical protein QKW49_07670 [Petroclostridium sp. X23]